MCRWWTKGQCKFHHKLKDSNIPRSYSIWQLFISKEMWNVCVFLNRLLVDDPFPCKKSWLLTALPFLPVEATPNFSAIFNVGQKKNVLRFLVYHACSIFELWSNCVSQLKILLMPSVRRVGAIIIVVFLHSKTNKQTTFIKIVSDKFPNQVLTLTYSLNSKRYHKSNRSWISCLENYPLDTIAPLNFTCHWESLMFIRWIWFKFNILFIFFPRVLAENKYE